MSLLFRIVYAAHANGTHHKLALDAVRDLAVANPDGWQRVFLKHADRFMDGAKAPDTVFKDFKNHVLHVRDGYWGGAPDLVAVWYERTVSELRDGKWADAVYSAGVLSHYVSDPMMPFHTGQTDAESAIHAATEWSINRSYNDLRALGLARATVRPETLAQGEGWLRATVLAAAERSNVHYERLIAHYDLKRGVVDPPSGLDTVARNVVADILIDTVATYATILAAAIDEANTTPPHVDLTLDTVLAAIKIPLKALAKRLSDAADRRVVEAQYDELIATGKVEKTLRDDDRMIRDLHAVEVAAPRRAINVHVRASVLKAPSQAPAPTDITELPTNSPTKSATSPRANRPAAPRPKLSPTDPVEAAPVIGPKLAARLDTVGIRTVADLLAADAHSLSIKLADSRFDRAAVATWQALARLVIDIPGINGSEAQLLHGAGYGTLASIRAASPDQVAQAVALHAATEAGRALLRGSDPPTPQSVTRWVGVIAAEPGSKAA